MTITQRMFEEMNRKGLKAADLARFLDVNKTVISAWKKRDNAPSSEYLVQICEFLKISPSYLLTGAEDPNSGLTDTEQELIQMFRKLPSDDQQNCYDIMKMMVERFTKKTTSSNWTQDSGKTA